MYCFTIGHGSVPVPSKAAGFGAVAASASAGAAAGAAPSGDAWGARNATSADITKAAAAVLRTSLRHWV